MERCNILLLTPSEDHPAALDQFLGARLAASSGPASNVISLEVDSFIRGNLQDIKAKVVRWSGKIAGIVGSTTSQNRLVWAKSLKRRSYFALYRITIVPSRS